MSRNPWGDQQAVQSAGTMVKDQVGALGEKYWEEIKMAVDSGASESVVNDDMLPNIETQEGDAYKRGVECEAATVTTIPNMGEKVFRCETGEAVKRNIKAQVCDVNKALLSVSEAVNAGNAVVFRSSGSYIEDDHTGDKMWMDEEGGMFTIKLWLPKDQGCTRPGR